MACWLFSVSFFMSISIPLCAPGDVSICCMTWAASLADLGMSLTNEMSLMVARGRQEGTEGTAFAARASSLLGPGWAAAVFCPSHDSPWATFCHGCSPHQGQTTVSSLRCSCSLLLVRKNNRTLSVLEGMRGERHNWREGLG